MEIKTNIVTLSPFQQKILSDTHAFVWFKDKTGFMNALRPDMTVFGINMKVIC